MKNGISLLFSKKHLNILRPTKNFCYNGNWSKPALFNCNIQHFDNSNSGLKIEDLPDTDHSDLAQNWMLSGSTIR